MTKPKRAARGSAEAAKNNRERASWPRAKRTRKIVQITLSEEALAAIDEGTVRAPGETRSGAIERLILTASKRVRITKIS
jgi:hypothetical protein